MLPTILHCNRYWAVKNSELKSKWISRRSSVWPPPHVVCNLLLINLHSWVVSISGQKIPKFVIHTYIYKYKYLGRVRRQMRKLRRVLQALARRSSGEPNAALHNAQLGLWSQHLSQEYSVQTTRLSCKAMSNLIKSIDTEVVTDTADIDKEENASPIATATALVTAKTTTSTTAADEASSKGQEQNTEAT